MTFCVQYDESGNIGATVVTSGDIPNCERQLVFEDIVDIMGKRVNLETLSLENAPIPEE